jgi:hypothetical protein
MKLFLFLSLFFFSAIAASSEGDCLNATSSTYEKAYALAEKQEAQDNYRSLASISYDSGIPLYSQYCCKVCTTGKACGNSCISRSKTCHKIGGCACDR